MKTTHYDIETIINKIDTALYKLDKKLSVERNDSERFQIYSGTIGRIEGIIQNAKAQNKIK